MNSFTKRFLLHVDNFSNTLMSLRTASWRIVAVGVSLTGLSSGCGGIVPDYAEDLVPVSGNVKIDGQPVEGAVVTFVAQTGPSRSSSAITDLQGDYLMETPPAGAGVLPGSYKVVISRLLMSDGTPVPPDVPPMDVGAAEQLPDQFSSFASPTLSAEVGSVGGIFPFDLKTR